MAKKFSKRVEDFTCEVCGTKVKGSGCTDHCPDCLYGKHVDFFPGDRKEPCRGLMKPLAVTKRNNKWQILYHCQRCGQKRFNKTAPNDNQEEITRLSQNPVSFRQVK